MPPQPQRRHAQPEVKKSIPFATCTEAMRITHPLIHKVAGLATSMAVRAWMSTLDCQVAYYDKSVDQTQREHDGRQRIYVFWHEYMLFPLYMRGHCDTSMLVSRHRDGEFIVRVGQHMGFDFVRGSTTRGSVAALLEMRSRSRHLNLAITPDGPKGPRRVMAPGGVFLASRLELPLVAIAMGFDRPWRAKSWDRFAVPRPFSRARAIVSPQILIPRDVDREGLEHYRVEVEKLLNRLTLEAEAWAESGLRKSAGEPLRPQHARKHFDPNERPPGFWRTRQIACMTRR
jgi:lysophospholipid acyltransferase (LPLAT)-like uncharacterized protein